MVCNQVRPTIALYGPKSSTTKRSTCRVTDHALIESNITHRQCGGPVESRQDSTGRTEMTKRDFHLHKGRKVQQLSRATQNNKDPMHIKTVNTQGEYKCIIMGGDDTCWVYRRKGYGAIDWLNRCTALWDTDGIYSGFN